MLLGFAFAHVFHTTSARPARCSTASSDPATGPECICFFKRISFSSLTMRSISRHSNKKDIRLAGIVRSRDGRRNKILFEAQRWPSCCESTCTPCTVLFGYEKFHRNTSHIASTLRVWQWFSRCECCTCSVCLSSELIESVKPSHMCIVTKSQVHWSATFGMSVHCPHNSKVSVSAASYRCNSPNHQP